MERTLKIVLVEPTHPGNIGATARAMKVMGLDALYLVAPRCFPDVEATVRASGAKDVLFKAKVVGHLKEAISDCHFVFGTSARSRSLSWPICSPRECAEKIQSLGNKNIAIVFGRESSGLNNKELSLCNYHVRIPTASDFSSLNLSSAVQVIAYELLLVNQKNVQEKLEEDSLATVDAVNGFLDHLRALLLKINFLSPKKSKFLFFRLQRLFNRTQLEEKEVHILRGILSTIEKRLL